MSFARRSYDSGLPGGLGKNVLAAWLIATGALHFVDISFSGLSTMLSLTALVAGVLLLLNR
jgi:hypothetical protein